MATSPNYNWPEPDNTDLVKNGALAIRTAVNAIDTSLAELKGGTTGQVLSKTSNTDMDFTWVAQDDSNAIQNAIVDAKGDLIAATANDTPARLAVGANNTFLRANSSAATGLEYGGAYTTFTPSWTGLTVGNATNLGRYLRIGNFVHVTQRLIFGSTTSISGNVISNFPFTGVGASGNINMGGITFLDTGIKGYSGFVNLSDANGYNLLVNDASTLYLGNASMNATTPFIWGTGDEIFINYVFEAA